MSQKHSHGISALQPSFEARIVNLRFVAGRVAMGQCFLLFVSFHHCSIFIFINMLPFPAGKTGEAWEPAKNGCPFSNRGEMDSKLFQRWKCVRLRFALLNVMSHYGGRGW